MAYRFQDLRPPSEEATVPYGNEEATLEETLEDLPETLEETRDGLAETLEETREGLAEDPGMCCCTNWTTRLFSVTCILLFPLAADDTTTVPAEGRKRPPEVSAPTFVDLWG